MTVLDWSPEKRLLVEVRKALNRARKAGSSTDFASLFPTELPEQLEVERGECICGEIKNKDGRRFYFSECSVYLEAGALFLRLPYESIASCRWIDILLDEREIARQKRERSDCLTLYDTEGGRYDLDDLGYAWDGIYTFFHWLIQRRQKAECLAHCPAVPALGVA